MSVGRDEVERLIQANRGLVRAIAKRFGHLANDPDLLQCGMIGLWRAAERWDGKRPFPPYARVCIRNAINDHLRAVKHWEPPVDDTAEAGAEDKRDLLRLIRQRYPRGSPERAVLLGLVAGQSKKTLAAKLGLSVYGVSALARSAWDGLEHTK